MSELSNIEYDLRRIRVALERIADHVDPKPKKTTNEDGGLTVI